MGDKLDLKLKKTHSWMTRLTIREVRTYGTRQDAWPAGTVFKWLKE